MRKAKTRQKIDARMKRQEQKHGGSISSNTSRYSSFDRYARKPAPDGGINHFHKKLRMMVTDMGEVSRYGNYDPRRMKNLFSKAVVDITQSRETDSEKNKALLKRLNKTNVTLEFYSPQNKQNDYVVDFLSREKTIYINPDKHEIMQKDSLKTVLNAFLQDNTQSFLTSGKVAKDRSSEFRKASVEIHAKTIKNVINDFTLDAKPDL